ncbi:hypothetical protein GOV09_04660 [Candidatus Woesearchaeota archaeon]|nr:hypothetical protein [Candidatus Woesearchaeota archaeon]
MAKKKAAKKAIAPKKKAVKKTVNPPKPNNFLKQAPQHKVFVLADGKILKDIRGLAYAMKEIGDDVFWHHVNDARNDFANWVRHVFRDEKLAEALEHAKDRVQTELVILRHLVGKI